MPKLQAVGRTSLPEHKISNEQCALLKRKLTLLDDRMTPTN
jgi:hypothetical protein